MDLPGFQALLGRHVPRVPEGAWTQVQQYSMQDLQSALDKADGKAPGPNHVEARFIKALPAPCNRVGFPPLGYPAWHRSQDRSKPPTHTTYPWGGMQ